MGLGSAISISHRTEANQCFPSLETVMDFVLPANFREWRHIIETRGSPKAQWEIRKVAIAILKILQKHAPAVFGDYQIDTKADVIRKVKYE